MDRGTKRTNIQSDDPVTKIKLNYAQRIKKPETFLLKRAKQKCLET